MLDNDEDELSLEDLPRTPLTVWKMDDHLTANTVLISAIDKLDTVVLAGRDNRGEWYFASSMDDKEGVKEHLKRFKHLLKGY